MSMLGVGGGTSNVDTVLVSSISCKVGASVFAVEWTDWFIYWGGGKIKVRERALV